MAKKKPSIEVSSDPIMAQLEEIKERVGALENVAGLANQPVIEKHVRAMLNSPQRKAIMRECKEPRTKHELVGKMQFKSVPALDHHLNPLREESLLHVDHSGDRMTFRWSPLVKRLPKSKLDSILNDDSK